MAYGIDVFLRMVLYLLGWPTTVTLTVNMHKGWRLALVEDDEEFYH